MKIPFFVWNSGPRSNFWNLSRPHGTVTKSLQKLKLGFWHFWVYWSLTKANFKGFCPNRPKSAKILHFSDLTLKKKVWDSAFFFTFTKWNSLPCPLVSWIVKNCKVCQKQTFEIQNLHKISVHLSLILALANFAIM